MRAARRAFRFVRTKRSRATMMGCLLSTTTSARAAVPVQAFVQRVRCSLSKMFPSLFGLRSRASPNWRLPYKMMRTRAAQTPSHREALRHAHDKLRISAQPASSIEERARSEAGLRVEPRLTRSILRRPRPNMKPSARSRSAALRRLMKQRSSPQPARTLKFATKAETVPVARMRRAN